MISRIVDARVAAPREPDGGAPDGTDSADGGDAADADEPAVAVALLAAGQAEAARRRLRVVVARGAASRTTRLNLALAEAQAGDRAAGLGMIRDIVAAAPEWPEAALRLAEHLRADGDRAAAEAAYRRVLELAPGHADALLSLGVLRLQGGHPAEAQLLLLRGCGVAAGRAEMWDALGVALMGTGDFADAESALAQAQRLAPERLDPALRRIEAALQAGTAEAELSRLEVATLVDPLDTVQLTARGVLLERLGRTAEAADILEAACALAPDQPGIAVALANALMHTERAADAEAALARAIALLPDQWLLQNNRAVILMRLHRFAEARDVLADLIETHGEQLGVLTNLSTALTALGEQDASVAAARRAIARAPDLHLGRRALVNALAYQDGVDGARLRDAASAAAARVPRAPGPIVFTRTRDPDRRLRVGLLSTHLKTHPVGWLTIAGLEALDPADFALVCIAQPESGDPIARRFRAIAAEWHLAGAETARARAERLRALDLDLLIDLSGFGDRGLLETCAHRIAPVQLKWVGMQTHSTGLPEIDWFITDRWETPAGFEPLYTERLLRMPDGYVCYSPPAYAPQVAALPACASGRVTFGCFNNLAKLTPAVIETWSRVLAHVAGSRLILKTHQFDDAATRARLHTAFARHGIDAERIVLRGGSPHRVLLAEYGEVDLVLDPFPYTGGLTTCEALWMGVPTLTLAGDTFSARHATSHLSNVGLADWVCADRDAYVAQACARAADLDALADLRADLRARVRASPLCDAPRFGRALSGALRHTWIDWCHR